MELGTWLGEPVTSAGVPASGGDPLIPTTNAWQCTLAAQPAADFAAELATNTLNGVELVPVYVPLTGTGG
jgi:hypothetical protein